MSTLAVVLGAGSGARMGGGTPKQFLPLAGKPILARTLAVFEQCPLIDGIVVVTGADWLEYTSGIASQAAPEKLLKVVAGGATRQESSYQGLLALNGFSGDDVVLVHDAVRPFVTDDIIRRCVDAAAQYGAADVAIPAVDTIVQAGDDQMIAAIPDRSTLFQGQTPQGFRLGVLRQAHELARRDGLDDATDDVRLVLRAGGTVRIVMGSPENMKLTHPSDIALAEFIAVRRRDPSLVSSCRKSLSSDAPRTV